MIYLPVVDFSHVVWDAVVDILQEHGDIGLMMVSLQEIYLKIIPGVNLIL